MRLTEANFEFIGRTKEISLAITAFAQRRDVMISGPPGVGKSAFIFRVRTLVPLHVFEAPTNIDRLCEEYVKYLGLQNGTFSAQERRTFALTQIKREGYPLCLDLSADQTAEDVMPLVEELIPHVPIWISTRLDPFQTGPWFKPNHEFVHLPISPLRKSDVRILIIALTARKQLPQVAANHVECFYRYSRGNPQLLKQFVSVVAELRPATDETFRLLLEQFKRI
jgi:hypothetical protein